MEKESKFAYNEFKCNNCGNILEAPEHYGKPMNVYENSWTCWKGDHPPCCGRPAVETIYTCCSKQYLLPVNNSVVELI